MCPLSKFNEFIPCLKSQKNWVQSSASLNLEKLNSNLSETSLNLNHGSNSLNSASYLNINSSDFLCNCELQSVLLLNTPSNCSNISEILNLIPVSATSCFSKPDLEFSSSPQELF